jgi:hypothetical protein
MPLAPERETDPLADRFLVFDDGDAALHGSHEIQCNAPAIQTRRIHPPLFRHNPPADLRRVAILPPDWCSVITSNEEVGCGIQQ